MRPYVQEIIDLTKQVDDLTSDNVDLKEQLKVKQLTIDKLNEIDEVMNNERLRLNSDNVDFKEQLKEFNKHMIIRDRQKDILWEYISEKDVDEISARFNKI
tara:strand:+ start:179 stop:481 length:303 start_codon:yes stop_codon:yes gene_type:complete